MQSIIDLYILCFFIVFVIFGYFYIIWRGSSYRFESRNSFIKVHAFLIMDNVPYIFRRFFHKSLGLYGEYLIFRELEKIPGHGKILTNLYLPQGETVTDTELDVLFIHESGIYVIESKNYSGYIFGNENDSHWIEQFSKKQKYSFYNPIRQNYSHRKSLEKIIENQSSKIIPMIVFTNNATLKKLYCPHNIVINKKDLRKEIINRLPNILTWEKINTITAQLIAYKNPTKIQEKTHTLEVSVLQNKSPSLL